MKNCNTIKLINIKKYLLLKKYCFLMKDKTTEQDKFAYSLLGKGFEKQKKRTIEYQREKQIKAIENNKK